MYPRIKQLRKDNDLTQDYIAGMLGMSQTGYSKYETGENDLSTRVLLILAELYQTSIDYILGRSEIRFPEEYQKDNKKSQEEQKEEIIEENE